MVYDGDDGVEPQNGMGISCCARVCVRVCVNSVYLIELYNP